MGANSLIIRKLMRLPSNVDEDELLLLPGVNVLVGEKDTGKTIWLKMLDYLLGSDKAATTAFDSKLFEKYDSISALVNICDKDILIERRWKERGFAKKIIIDGTPILQEEFSEEILKKLNIPILHFPKGNPFTEKSWPQLSFRTLLRHIYRREDLWYDFAAKQFDSEQHASLSLFLGFADKLFPDEYGDLVSKQKRVATLQEMKDQFVDMLQEVSRELIVSRDLSVAPTSESIHAAKARLRSQIDELNKKRNNILKDLKQKAIDNNILAEHEIKPDQVDSISEKIVTYRAHAENLNASLSQARKRLAELRDYYETVRNEEAKLKRVQSAGNILGQLKANYCPVCDHAVKQEHSNNEFCYLCKRPHQQNESAIEAGKARIDFDMRQLRAERQELDQLIHELEIEEREEVAEIRNIETEIQRLKSRLKPLSVAVATILPADIGLIDQEVGGLGEQILQLERVVGTLARRSDLSAQISGIENEVASLKAELEKLRGEVDFQSTSDILSDGMNTYLNALNVEDHSRWEKGRVSFKIKERGFEAFVSGDVWSAALGATSKVLFLLSYHYSLLSLSGKERFFYPGLVILDFPVQLADGSSIADKENYLIEPFIHLLKKPEYKETQVIAAGRAFKGLENINRIELNHVWR